MQLDGVAIPYENLWTWDVIKPFSVLFCSNVLYRDQYTERNQLEEKIKWKSQLLSPGENSWKAGLTN